MSNVSDNVPALRLGSRLDIVAAETLHLELLKLAPAQDELTIDAQDVELIDTPAIQVLLAAATHQMDRGARFLVTNPSEAFSAAMALIGLSSKCEQWSETNG